MMGAHVLRAGVNRHIIDMMERGFLDHLAMNGAGAVHLSGERLMLPAGHFARWRELALDWLRHERRSPLVAVGNSAAMGVLDDGPGVVEVVSAHEKVELLADQPFLAVGDVKEGVEQMNRLLLVARVAFARGIDAQRRGRGDPRGVLRNA